jgi:hypothetical protein
MSPQEPLQDAAPHSGASMHAVRVSSPLRASASLQFFTLAGKADWHVDGFANRAVGANAPGAWLMMCVISGSLAARRARAGAP